jgi:hypothetical protein
MLSRIKSAIDFLRDKQSVQVGDLRLGINDAGDVQVTGWSNYTDFRNLNRAICLRELQEIKNIFFEMLASSEELRAFVKGKVVEYNLDYDDYGKGSIGICSERNELLLWHIEMN